MNYYCCKCCWRKSICCCCCGEKQKNIIIPVTLRSFNAVIENDSSKPFPGPWLNEDVSNYIFNICNRDLHPYQSCSIQITFANEKDGDQAKANELKQAFNNTYNKMARDAEYELYRVSYEGYVSGGIGISLAFCILLIMSLIAFSGALNNLTTAGTGAVQFFKGVGIVVMWVCIWHPTEALLYTRFAIKKRIVHCKDLADAPINMIFKGFEREHHDVVVS